MSLRPASGTTAERGIRRGSEPVAAIKRLRQRRLHKSSLRYHDPAYWPLLREALKGVGRADLIGPRADQSVPHSQPVARGAGAARPALRKGGTHQFTTKGVPVRK